MDREFYRLQAVERFKQLQPDIVNDLGDMVSLAAQLCNTPVAVVTLLDKDTQWFKIAKGTDVRSAPREVSFCNHTIQQNDVVIVSDALKDERYQASPLVTGEPNMRFYAGAPLITKDGFGVGALCVIDFEARDLTGQQQNTLKILSKQVMNLMELNWNLHALAQQNEQTQKHKQVIETSQLKLRAFFDSTTDIHILLNKELEIMAYNKSASRYICNICQQELPLATGY